MLMTQIQIPDQLAQTCSKAGVEVMQALPMDVDPLLGSFSGYTRWYVVMSETLGKWPSEWMWR